jgi:hypothetical protein
MVVEGLEALPLGRNVEPDEGVVADGGVEVAFLLALAPGPLLLAGDERTYVGLSLNSSCFCALDLSSC